MIVHVRPGNDVPPRPGTPSDANGPWRRPALRLRSASWLRDLKRVEDMRATLTCSACLARAERRASAPRLVTSRLSTETSVVVRHGRPPRACRRRPARLLAIPASRCAMACRSRCIESIRTVRGEKPSVHCGLDERVRAVRRMARDKERAAEPEAERVCGDWCVLLDVAASEDKRGSTLGPAGGSAPLVPAVVGEAAQSVDAVDRPGVEEVNGGRIHGVGIPVAAATMALAAESPSTATYRPGRWSPSRSAEVDYAPAWHPRSSGGMPSVPGSKCDSPCPRETARIH